MRGKTKHTHTHTHTHAHTHTYTHKGGGEEAGRERKRKSRVKGEVRKLEEFNTYIRIHTCAHAHPRPHNTHKRT